MTTRATRPLPSHRATCLLLTKNLLPVAGQAIFFVNRHNGKGQGAAKRKAMKRNTVLKRAYNDGL
jgi:hypothetical protein